MRRSLLLLFLLPALLAPARAALCGGEVLTAAGETGTVLSVVDGDTIRVRIDGTIDTVRLIGVDAAETVPQTDDRFGHQASAYLFRLIGSKTVRLEGEAGTRNRDSHGRLLRYAYLEDGTDVNAKLLEDGYAHAYTKYPFARQDEFRELERKAQEAGRGLWAPVEGKPGEKPSGSPSGN